jgi:hypothetical protein
MKKYNSTCEILSDGRARLIVICDPEKRIIHDFSCMEDLEKHYEKCVTDDE